MLLLPAARSSNDAPFVSWTDENANEGASPLDGGPTNDGGAALSHGVPRRTPRGKSTPPHVSTATTPHGGTYVCVTLLFDVDYQDRFALQD